EYQGDQPLSYVISKNLHRRHLTASQRAIMATDIKPLLEVEAKKRQATSLPGVYGGKPLVENFPQAVETGKSRDQAGDLFGVSGRYVSEAENIKEKEPELAEKVRSGDMTIAEAKKKAQKAEREKERHKLAESAKSLPADERWNVSEGDINNYQAGKQFDFIITDPPYPKEYLQLYEVLAKRANEWLKDGGLLIAMCGQSYLNQIYEMMSKHIEYYWTAAYLTPGESPSLWQKNVIPKWKPLLIFAKGKYSGKMFSDVYTSGANEKGLHKWGQSESGMYSIISNVCLPGQSIFDPFCGSGTTGVAALKHGCLFHGIDIESENVNISKRRLNDCTKA
ncbi:MAG TPA: site-specific DNA-methyltransferase, partial [Chitinophagales bacterium]|nr:site-specific DNA-methyltransferase [Chitinophagales bacterium]